MSHTDEKFANFMRVEDTTKYVYASIRSASSKIENISEKWSEELLEDININKCVKQIQKQTYVSKYRSFQYRLLMRAVVTNVQLYHWGIKPSRKCSFCDQDIETYQHLLFDCICVAPIWEKVNSIAINMNIEVNITYPNIICNTLTPDINSCINTICLIGKQYIYRCKCKGEKPNVKCLEAEIFSYKRTEKYYAIKDMNLRKYYKQ